MIHYYTVCTVLDVRCAWGVERMDGALDGDVDAILSDFDDFPAVLGEGDVGSDDETVNEI